MDSLTAAWRRVRNAVRFGQITGVTDGGPVQTAQVKGSYLETFGELPVMQQFGLASSAPAGSDAVVLAPNGDPTSGVVVATNNQGARPVGQQPGESTFYNAFGMTIHMSQGGIVIQANGKPVVLTGDLHVSGAVIAGFGGGDQVGVQTHDHGGGPAPTPGT